MVVAMTESSRRSPGRSPSTPPTREEIITLARFARRLERHIQRAGLSTTELADMIGTSKQAVSSWTRGENFPSHLNMIRLANILGVGIGELWGHEATEESSTVTLANMTPMLPLYSDEQAAGEVIMGLSKAGTSVEFIASPLGLSEHAVAIQVSSRANTPLINPEDIVYVDPSLPLEAGRWVFAFHEGEYVIRRYTPKSDKTIRGGWLMPANSAYPPQQIGRRTEIIGIVTGRHESL